MNPTSTFFRNAFLSVLMLTLFSASELMAQYCYASGGTYGQFISNVHIGSINNTSGSNGYADYTSLSINMDRGISYSISVICGNYFGNNEKCRIWMDWNHNNSFEDSTEGISLTDDGNGNFTGNIIPPVGAQIGQTRLRVRINYNAVPPACGSTSYGEVEDYMINVLPPSSMAYQSTIVTQNNTSGAQKCGTNVEILRIQVNMSGTISPLDISKFVIRTEGSTSPAITNNVSNIDIYYTGSNPDFDATTLFGYAAPQNASGDINIGGSQTLMSGTNYFWVVYDMNSSSATVGHILDARLNQIKVNSTNYNIPAGAPSGSRTIIPCVGSPGGVAANNTLWLDGSVANITKDGSNLVSKWTSSTAGGSSVSQIVDLKKPIFHNADKSYNYNPYIKFDGSNDEMQLQYQYPYSDPDLMGNNGTVIIVSAPVGNGNAENQTIFGYRRSYNRNYQIKPRHNCGWGEGSNGWQMKWNTILPSIATPITRPQIFGIRAEVTPSGFAFKNGKDGTTYSTTSTGAVVSDALSLGSRGDFEGQNHEYSPSTLSEVILYDRPLTKPELNRIQSYLALKYGITMGKNGTSTKYYAADGSIIWNSTANADYNYDIAGIGREDIGNMDKRKSHSINGTGSGYSDILTVATGDNDNFDYPTMITQNASYFVWGRNDENAIGDYLVDVAAPIITRLRRVWKAQETGNTGMMTLEFDMSKVPGVDSNPGENDLNAIRLLVDADGVFASGATEIPPAYVDNVNHIVRFTHNFDATTGYFFTLGSVNYYIAPLPIELSSFTAECNGQSVELNWTTQSETNNAFFTIEKSKDAKVFKAVGMIEGKGHSTSSVHYSWTDDSNTPGLAYYRLKQTDFDGKFEYHDVISKDCGNDFPFRIYPNPTKDGVFIQNYTSSKDGLNIEIYNALGQRIDALRLTQSEWINLPEAQGIYFIRVRDGAKVYSEKVVKQ